MERKSFLPLSCHRVCKTPVDVDKDLTLGQIISPSAFGWRAGVVVSIQFVSLNIETQS